jgi:hypothetical protein
MRTAPVPGGQGVHPFPDGKNKRNSGPGRTAIKNNIILPSFFFKAILDFWREEWYIIVNFKFN